MSKDGVPLDCLKIAIENQATLFNRFHKFNQELVTIFK